MRNCGMCCRPARTEQTRWSRSCASRPGSVCSRNPQKEEDTVHKTAMAAALLVASTGIFAAQGNAAAEFPTRPIRIVVGFTPGGQPDIFSRMIGVKLGEALGQPVVVDNRPGAGSAIGAKIVADATPDGHTLLCVSASHVISPAVRKLNYDPLKDFAGITQMYSASYLLVAAPALGVKDLKGL